MQTMRRYLEKTIPQLQAIHFTQADTLLTDIYLRLEMERKLILEVLQR